MNAQTHNASRPRLDLAGIRSRLDGVRGQQYWRSLDEVAETPEFQELFHREFPDSASEWADGLSRRSFLKMAAASLALSGLTACTRQPNHEILPYVRQPEELVPGEPMHYATSMVQDGYATGVLVKAREGHPIKVEGNPLHPASLGGSSIWMQASILDLYDPDRSQALTRRGEPATWNSFLEELNQLIREHGADRGAGLRFLTGTVTSPTLAAQLRRVLKAFPQAKWHQYDPVCRDNIREGARLAFGEVVEMQCRFDQATVILSLDSDFLHTHPQRLRYARDFSNARRVIAGHAGMSRLYVLESSPTITGAAADHRLAIASSEIVEAAHGIAQQLGAVPAFNSQLSSPNSTWLQALVRDLQQNRGKSIVIAGECQPPATQALAHALNDVLGNVGNTIFYTEPPEAEPVNQLNSLRDLAIDMNSGAVKSLFILGGNPAYTAPADFQFASLLASVERSIHLGLEFDETAALCTMHIPQAHYLEAWGDARSFDGTVSLLQPLIAPLYDGKSACEILEAFSQRHPARADYDVIRDCWRERKVWPDFEKGWRRALHDGLIAGTELPEKKVRLNRNAAVEAAPAFRTSAPSKPSEPDSDSESPIEVCFRPDPSVWDGCFANNGWLQECPKPISKLTWDNAMLISPTLAQKLQLENDDVLELNAHGHSVRGPVWVQPGQTPGTITLYLGYGRRRVGRVGAGAGFDAYPLRTSASPWHVSGVELRKTGEQHRLVATQTHHHLHGPERQILRQGTLEEFRSDEDFVKKSIESPKAAETLYNPGEYKFDGCKWGMSIDLTTCIGCNACLLACNAENNIPVVGKDQVGRNREMHWIRIDTYYQGSLDHPGFNHLPTPCMHCEHAPCELVCPVAATVHDHEGLNLQIYNRCVGTRFCSNNCPYKVRRFNFLWYSDYRSPSLKPMYNPDVTVRWRGVIEKCTYCVQRISRARITAEKENRRIRDGEVQTACQQACPARAIVFGDLNDPDAKVTALKQHPLDYPMLGGLNTRPRTTYLAKLQNPNPEMGSQ